MPLFVTPIPEGRSKAGATTYYSIPGAEITTNATVATTANILRYEPIRVVTPITLDQLVLEVTSAGAGGTTARMGIYNASTDLQPTSLVVDGGTVAVDSTGVKTASITTALPAGLYLFVYNTNGSPVVRVFRGGFRGMGLLNTIGATPEIRFLTVSSTYAAFAATGVAWDTVTAGGAAADRIMACRISIP